VTSLLHHRWFFSNDDIAIKCSLTLKIIVVQKELSLSICQNARQNAWMSLSNFNTMHTMLWNNQHWRICRSQEDKPHTILYNSARNFADKPHISLVLTNTTCA